MLLDAVGDNTDAGGDGGGGCFRQLAARTDIVSNGRWWQSSTPAAAREEFPSQSNVGLRLEVL